MSQPAQPRLLSASDVADILGVSLATVKRKAASGAIPTLGRLGDTGAYVFDADAIDTFTSGAAA